jgi:hypothetical protein
MAVSWCRLAGREPGRSRPVSEADRLADEHDVDAAGQFLVYFQYLPTELCCP